jgi:hypothetical protein
MSNQKITNDSVRLNDLLQDATMIQSKDLLNKDYFGEVTITFKKGMMVHMTKKEGVKLG